MGKVWSLEPTLTPHMVIPATTIHTNLYQHRQPSPVQSSQVQSSPIKSSQVQSSPVQSSQVQSSPVGSSPVQSSTLKSNQIKSRQVQSGPLKPSPIKSSQFQSSPVQCSQAKRFLFPCKLSKTWVSKLVSKLVFYAQSTSAVISGRYTFCHHILPFKSGCHT